MSAVALPMTRLVATTPPVPLPPPLFPPIVPEVTTLESDAVIEAVSVASTARLAALIVTCST